MEPLQLRNPWYRAENDGAQSVSLTDARMSAEENLLKRSFPTESGRPDGKREQKEEGVAEMKRRRGDSVDGGGIPEEIRAKLPNVVWSREEEEREPANVDNGIVDNTARSAVTEPFEFKKRNAWENHKNQRKRQATPLERDASIRSDPLSAVMKLQDAGPGDTAGA